MWPLPEDATPRGQHKRGGVVSTMIVLLVMSFTPQGTCAQDVQSDFVLQNPFVISTHTSRIYRTLDDADPEAQGPDGCQNTLDMDLPDGWTFAPDDTETGTVAREYSWDTNCVVVLNSKHEFTSLGTKLSSAPGNACPNVNEASTPLAVVTVKGLGNDTFYRVDQQHCPKRILLVSIEMSSIELWNNATDEYGASYRTYKHAQEITNSNHPNTEYEELIDDEYEYESNEYEEYELDSNVTISYARKTSGPSKTPSKTPTNFPTQRPTTTRPTLATRRPTNVFSRSPTKFPTSRSPTVRPTTRQPTTRSPTAQPTIRTPTLQPVPTAFPTSTSPTTKSPTVKPTMTTREPTLMPSSRSPTLHPTSVSPSSRQPTVHPTFRPSKLPTLRPSKLPTTQHPSHAPQAEYESVAFGNPNGRHHAG